MKKRILLALDLEGVNFVVGEPYKGLLQGTEQWKVACEQAVKEINAAATALFAAGVEVVAVWDNHSGGHNLEPHLLDKRITLLDPDLTRPRMYFAEGAFDAVCFFGYHAMEGTLGGVLSHTMNSSTVQYYKCNGDYIGEVDMDAYIAASHNIPTCFFCGGNIACAQAQRALPGIVTVQTKTELSRNEAIFRDNAQLLDEIAQKIVLSVQNSGEIKKLQLPCLLEKSFKRVEDAAKYLQKVTAFGVEAFYPDDKIMGKDGHTIAMRIQTAKQFARCV